MFDVQEVRKDFPILGRKMHEDKPLVYLDSTASSQKPRSVIDAISFCYETYYANIHRGVYEISAKGTEAYALAKQKVAAFIHAREVKKFSDWSDTPELDGHPEIIFTRNATESINLVAQTWGRKNIGPHDQIISTVMEHHSNIVPWQELAKEKGAKLRYVDVDDDGFLKLDELESLLKIPTKLVVVTHMSNVLGTINPVKKIGQMAHAAGAKFLVDGAQGVPHLRVDVQDVDCDFMAFSGHKMLGPSGIGVLFAKREILEDVSSMPPYMFGGDMIKEVTLEGASWNILPWRFEAGTPNIVDGIALGAAVDYLENIGMTEIEQYEQQLTSYALEALSELEGVKVYGPPAQFKGGAVAFTVGEINTPDEIHAHDLGTIADERGVCIRTGHHCAMPLHKRLGLNATARASFYLYTTQEEIDALVEVINSAKRLFRR
jgi:cysteine desulfurase / selenocysteine lyase